MKINEAVQNMHPSAINTNTGVDRAESLSNKGKAQTDALQQIDSGSTTATKSNTLQQLEKALSVSPTYDAQKVDAIKSAVDAGSFNVDTGKVADGMIAAAATYLQAQSK